jgi:hypothetical protein
MVAVALFLEFLLSTAVLVKSYVVNSDRFDDLEVLATTAATWKVPKTLTVFLGLLVLVPLFVGKNSES